MEIGIFVFTTDSSIDTAVLAKRAEELGFESFWVPEHPIMPVEYTTRDPDSPDGIVPEAYNRIVDPFVALARASAVTTTIILGTGICLVPERNPFLLAKEGGHPGPLLERALHFRNRGGLAQRRNRYYGGRLCSPLVPNAGRCYWL